MAKLENLEENDSIVIETVQAVTLSVEPPLAMLTHVDTIFIRWCHIYTLLKINPQNHSLVTNMIILCFQQTFLAHFYRIL
jgi:hypothetical protein